MKFIHIADLHLDSKFDNISSINGLPTRRRIEQKSALKEIIEYVKENDIEMILISGDLYEQKYIKKSSIEYMNKLFSEVPNVKIFISPGNHDPFLQNSFYNTFKWSENVHIFKDNIERIDFNGIHIYGYGFTDYYCENSKIEEIEIENKNDINILITHSSLDGAKDDEKQYNPLRSNKLKKIGFDYIALGHIHKPYYNEEKDQKIFYPGSPLSLGFDELGEHGILEGNIEKNKLEVKFIKIDNRKFEEIELNISNCQSDEEIITEIENLPLNEDNFYKIILTGKRYFIIDLDKIKKVIQTENIIKIKDKTQIGLNLEKLQYEENIQGIFIRNMLKKQKEESLSKEFIEKAIEIGLEVLQ